MLKLWLSLWCALAAVGCGSSPKVSSSTGALVGYGNTGGVESLAAGELDDWYGQGANIWVVAPHASGTTITGINGTWLNAADQDTIIIDNRGSVPLVFAHEHTGSAAAHRLSNPGGADVRLPPGRIIWYTWDVTIQRWHPHVDIGGWGVASTSTPTRALESAFCPNADRDVRGVYSVRIVATSTLLAAELGRVDLLVDTANPPTTVRARVAGGVSGVVATDTTEGVLSYVIPAGHCALLQAVDEAGSPVQSITAQAEQVL